MNIRALEYLVSLAEYRHFRRAAEACHVSQPTLSGQIRKLEDELGTLLLERDSRKVLFTQSGLLLVEQARVILREIKALKEMAAKQSDVMAGPLYLGLIPTIAPYLLPHIIPLLHNAYPKLEMFLSEAHTQVLIADLYSGKLDCAIMAKVKESGALIAIELFDEPMMLALNQNHPWCQRERISILQLTGEKVLMLEDGHCLRDQALGYCFTHGAQEDKRFRATSMETLRNMIAANIGITLMPALAVPTERVRDSVCYLPFDDPAPVRSIELVYRPGSQLRGRYEQLAETIRNHMQYLPHLLLEKSI